MHVKQPNPIADYYYSILAMLMTHDSLVRFDSKLNPIPQLATKFGSSPDGRVWTFDLAATAKWHDGLPVTADDVRFTFAYLVEHNLPSRWIADLIEHTEVTGRRIVFHLKRPYRPFLINAGFVVRILPRHIWEKIDEPYRSQAREMTVGCGPYVFDGFDPDSGMIGFRANQGYHGRVPRAERVEYHRFGTMDTLTLALEKNQIDVFYNYAAGFPPPYLRALEGRPGLHLAEADSMGVPAVLGFNLERPLLQGLNVRRAIALALDYSRLNQCLTNGRGVIPGPQLVPPAFPFHLELPRWRRDLDGSRSLLGQAGFIDTDGDGMRDGHDGKPLSLSLLARSDLWGDSQVVKLLVHDLGQVGIRAAVQMVDLSTWQALLRQGRYDLVLFRTTPWGMMMHAGYGSGYFDSRASGGVNISRLKDDAFFRLCDRLLTGTEPALEERLAVELQSYYATQLPAIALCWGKSFYPFGKNWRGFQVGQLEGGIINSLSWKDLDRASPDTEGEP